ncbi:hypothetical protein ACHAXA_009962 [Cyclostephanos tholiformis]|uniref:Transcription initiation factor TFIID subunit 12 domain-containing protein n=1 Tax=Cyclostephanos tholiformis TaxID=382380 RepID=A0ABD3R960_9STRA
MAPPKGKGKDLSRMFAPPGLSSTSSTAAPGSALDASPGGTTTTLISSPSGGAPRVVPSPSSRAGKPKGKDFSRMTGPPHPAAQQPPPELVAVQPPPPPPPPPPVVVLGQPPAEATTSVQIMDDARRWNEARAAAGMPPILNHQLPAPPPPTNNVASGIQQQPDMRQSTQQMPIPPPLQQQQQQSMLTTTAYAPAQLQPLVPNPTSLFNRHHQQQMQQQQMQQQQMQQQVLMSTPAQMQQQQLGAQVPMVTLQPNASLNSPNAVIHPAAPQPTKRPGWSEARLSTMNMTLDGESPGKSGTGKSTTAKRKSQLDFDDGYGKPSLAPMLGEKLQNLCHSIDPSYALDSEVQERLVEMADAFVEKVTRDSIKLARHRGSTTMDVVDVAVALKKGFNMEVPGLGPPSVANGGSSSALHGAMMGGWLFADKVSVVPGGRCGGERGGKRPYTSKKRKKSGAAAAAAM